MSTQAYINRKLTELYKRRAAGRFTAPLCQGCGKAKANDHDHTISQRKCKQSGHPEWIYDNSNVVDSCRECHREWEEYKSGKWLQHLNAGWRLLYFTSKASELDTNTLAELLQRTEQYNEVRNGEQK